MRKFTIGVGETISRNGRPIAVGVDGLACWPRDWKPVGVDGHVGVGFHINVGHLLKDVAKVATAPERLAVEAVKDPKKLLHDIGKDVAKVAKIEKFVLEQAQGLISLVPGLGTAISTAIGAGLAALEGGSALDIAIKIAYSAIPIPPGIKTFTDLVLGAVLDIVNAVVKGGDLAKVLERLIAEEMARALPDNVRAAGTTVLTTLTPTVLQALTGKLPALPGVPPLPSVPGLPALPTAASVTAALPAVPSVSSITSALPAVPGVQGVLGDKIDDFVAQLQSQYAAMNLPATVKAQTDPIFNALVSMVHSMNMGPAILLAVRTGVGAKLPAGAARDIGLHIFDTLAHLILGKLFKGKPTQAQVAAQPSQAELTAIRLAATRGQALPASVTPVAQTAAAYKPIAAAEVAQSTTVTVAIPSAVGVTAVYGPYPQTTTAPAAAPPSSTPAATAPAGTTAGVGAQIEETIPPGWKLWTDPKVPPELTKFAMAVRDKINSYPYGSIAETTTDALGRTIGAWKSHHTWSYLLQPDGTRKLTTGLWIPGVSLVIKQEPPAIGTSRGGGGGHGGGGGRGDWGGGRPVFRGGGWGRPWGGYGYGGWDGGPWWPYVIVTTDEAACANWGDPIGGPPELLPSLRATLANTGGGPVTVRGADGNLYRLSYVGFERGGIEVRPCVGVIGVGSADDDVLRAMALDLLGSLRRTGAPQGATRAVKNFVQAWNAASSDQPITATDWKYTQEIAAALSAALSALAPGSGAAPAAVL
jgi:hypothetical protein